MLFRLDFNIHCVNKAASSITTLLTGDILFVSKTGNLSEPQVKKQNID